MYIPNAFSPEGINKIFKPVAVFLSNENYFFQIYNRFGQMIFETNNPEVGWDGKYLNEFVKQGVYFYLLHYSLPNHTIIQKKGSVTVIL
jgi:gliding motility-associated-like protein